MVPSNVCAKFNTYIATNDQVGQNQIVSYLANMLGVSNQVAYDLLKRCCPNSGSDNPTDIPCERVPRELCIKFLDAIQNNDQIAIQGVTNTLVSMLGVSYNQAYDLLKRCCRPDDGSGTGVDFPCDRVPREFCIQYLQGNMSVISVFANQFGLSQQDAADILKRCCRPDNGNTGSDRRFKDCYDCDARGGVNVIRVPANQPCPRGRTAALVDANGLSKNPCPPSTSTGTTGPISETPIRDTGMTSGTTRPNMIDSFGNAVSPIKSGGITTAPVAPVSPSAGVSSKTGGFSQTQPISSSTMATPMRNFGGDGEFMFGDY